jgi:hypothetical protein
MTKGQAAELQAKWTFGTPCEHRVQHLSDTAMADTGVMMGMYYCDACGAEICRPYRAYQRDMRQSLHPRTYNRFESID